jgi:hypothetical protein
MLTSEPRRSARDPHALRQQHLVERIGETLEKFTDALAAVNRLLDEIRVEGQQWTVLHANIWENYFQNVADQMEVSSRPISL